MDTILKEGHAIAVVSGKGGSGKTLISSVMTEIFDSAGKSIILVDADTGTAGLTYYFGLELVSNTSVGISDLFLDPKQFSEEQLAGIMRPIKDFKQARFISVGDYRRFPKDLPEDELASRMIEIVSRLKLQADYIIFDCRGGLDDESLAVCKAVDDILLIVETDTTSYQATQHLVDILSQNKLSGKLKGFIVNKVFDDPRELAKSGTAAFRSQFLTAIPFDFDAMREFFAGNIPKLTSVFGIHVQYGLRKAYPDIPEPSGSVYRFSEYSEIGFVNLDSLRGGIVVSLLIVALSVVLLEVWYRHASLVGTTGIRINTPICIALLAVVGLIGSLSGTRQAIGRFVNRLVTTVLLIRKR